MSGEMCLLEKWGLCGQDWGGLGKTGEVWTRMGRSECRIKAA